MNISHIVELQRLTTPETPRVIQEENLVFVNIPSWLKRVKYRKRTTIRNWLKFTVSHFTLHDLIYLENSLAARHMRLTPLRTFKGLYREQ